MDDIELQELQQLLEQDEDESAKELAAWLLLHHDDLLGAEQKLQVLLSALTWLSNLDTTSNPSEAEKQAVMSLFEYAKSIGWKDPKP